jgi:hypothetical protein
MPILSGWQKAVLKKIKELESNPIQRYVLNQYSDFGSNHNNNFLGIAKRLLSGPILSVETYLIRRNKKQKVYFPALKKIKFLL